MRINCGFEQRIKEGRKYKYKYKNIQNIEIEDGLLPSQVRSILRSYAPEGEGWSLIGYAVVDRKTVEFIQGGVIPEPEQEKDTEKPLERGWYRCKKCYQIFESTELIGEKHICYFDKEPIKDNNTLILSEVKKLNFEVLKLEKIAENTYTKMTHDAKVLRELCGLFSIETPDSDELLLDCASTLLRRVISAARTKTLSVKFPGWSK